MDPFGPELKGDDRTDPPDRPAGGALGLLAPVDRMDPGPAKVRAYHYAQKVWSLYNPVGMCTFVGVPIGPLGVNQLVDCVRAVTGWDVSLWELLKVAERSDAMARVFNCREGFTPEDDILPGRMLEGLENGAIQGAAVDRGELRRALLMYYEMQGWDAATGFPKPARLAELDLTWAAVPPG